MMNPDRAEVGPGVLGEASAFAEQVVNDLVDVAEVSGHPAQQPPGLAEPVPDPGEHVQGLAAYRDPGAGVGERMAPGSTLRRRVGGHEHGPGLRG